MTIKEWEQKIGEMPWMERLLKVRSLIELQRWPEYVEHFGSQLELIYAFATVIRKLDNPDFDPERLGR